MIGQFFNAIGDYFKVPAALFKYKLWPFLLFGALTCLIIGGGFLIAALTLGDNLSMWITSLLTDRLEGKYATMAIGWLGRIFILVLGLIVYKYVVLIIMGPFMSPLSERIEQGYSGAIPDGTFSVSRILKEMIRGVRLTFRNLIREVFFTIIVMILSFIPFVSVISVPLIFIIQAYYAGFGNMDYYLERHYPSVSGTAAYVRGSKGIAIGNGIVYLLLLIIPVLGLLIAPTFGATAATLSIMDDEGA